jgi:hypothetical protein
MTIDCSAQSASGIPAGQQYGYNLCAAHRNGSEWWQEMLERIAQPPRTDAGARAKDGRRELFYLVSGGCMWHRDRQ